MFASLYHLSLSSYNISLCTIVATHFEKITHIEIFSKCIKSETKSAYYAKKKKIKSQTVVSRTLWGYVFLFLGTHRFKFLCSFEHLRVFLGTMLGPVDGRGVRKRQHGAPQRWSRGWKLIEGIVEHPCVRHCCSICRPVSNDSIDGTDTRKVTLCTNSC